jgi:hypothetical protein
MPRVAQNRGELNVFDNFFEHVFHLGEPSKTYATVEHAFQSVCHLSRGSGRSDTHQS